MLQILFIINIAFWPIGIPIGDSLLSLNVMLMVPIGIVWLLRRLKINKLTYIVSVIFITVIVFSVFCIALINPYVDKLSKALISAPLFITLLIISLEVGTRSKIEDWLMLRRASILIICIALVFVAVEVIFPALYSSQRIIYHVEYKYSGLYYEPSHLAISLFPCFAILLSSGDKKYVRKGMILFLLTLLVSRSSSLIVLMLCFALYRLISSGNIQKGIKYALFICFFIVFACLINYELLVKPTVSRFISVFLSDTHNFSSLIYLKGWQDAIANIIRTNGLGLGFNMMGSHPLPDVPIRDILLINGLLDLNNDDGSFLLSKMISEFGLFGVFYFIWVIFDWLRHEVLCGKLECKLLREVNTIQGVLMFSFILTSIVRSTGYFQGSLFLWASALAGTKVIAYAKKCSINKGASIKSIAV